MWVNEGDRNTRFFHQKASNSRRKNRIKRLKDDNEVWQETNEGIERTILMYFNKLFRSVGRDEDVVEDIISVVSPRVTVEMNDRLGDEFSDEEIKEALFQMHPSKASGPNGISPFFYQKYWSIVCSDVTEAVKAFLLGEPHGTLLYHTYVVLILKVKEVTNMTHLRPISLCNVLYKIGAKVLANRLKDILLMISFQWQSAFVPGRIFSDNSLVATELAHFLHNKMEGRNDAFCFEA